jgi:vaccinia related kinase
MEPATGSKIQPEKKVSSNGNDSIGDGDILIDNAQNRWKLGRSIGVQDCSEVYLASSKTDEPVGSDAQHIVKVEPLKKRSLYREINCYLRMARSDMIDKWNKGSILKHVGLFRCMGSGSHVYRGEKCRFLLLERYGRDLGKLFLQSGRRFPVMTVFYIGIQILDTLEYIHSLGYIHADIKGPSLLLGCKGTKNCVYLPDFGTACRYFSRNGVHEEYGCGQSIVHAGSSEYVYWQRRTYRCILSAQRPRHAWLQHASVAMWKAAMGRQTIQRASIFKRMVSCPIFLCSCSSAFLIQNHQLC